MPATLMISYKDLDPGERLRERLEERCRALAVEFPETTHFEIALAADGAGFTAHGHVTGDHTEVAAQATAAEPAPAADKLMDALERQLRRLHDKKIFARRRSAQRESRRRKTGA